MSYRARRVSAVDAIEDFDWSGDAAPEAPGATPGHGTADAAHRLEVLEREAFAKGYEQGERAGLEAGSARSAAMLRRLSDTIEELADLRTEMIRCTEAQMVRLALAMARRVVRREINLDEDFALALARVALDRLGDRASATIKLHPEDFAIAAGRKVEDWAGSHVSVVADAGITRGGCVVESDLGTVDATIEAQFDEIARAVLSHDRHALERAADPPTAASAPQPAAPDRPPAAAPREPASAPAADAPGQADTATGQDAVTQDDLAHVD